MIKKTEITKLTIIITFFVSLLFIIPYFIPVSEAKIIKSNPFPNSYFINVDNMRLHYRYWKSADENPENWILLVHGMGGSTFSWENNAKYFAKDGFNVVAVDVPPYGYSDRYPYYNHSIDNRAKLLLEFMDHLNPNVKWNLIGHSMGGSIIQAISIINPCKIEKVVFVAPALFADLTIEKAFEFPLLIFRPFERLTLLIAERFYIRPKLVEKLLESAQGEKPTQKQVEEYYKPLKVPGTALAFLRATTTAKIDETIDGTLFDKPAIAIIGVNDTWIPVNQIEIRLEKITSIKPIYFEDAAHNLMETHYEKFNKIVSDFLKE